MSWGNAEFMVVTISGVRVIEGISFHTAKVYAEDHIVRPVRNNVRMGSCTLELSGPKTGQLSVDCELQASISSGKSEIHRSSKIRGRASIADIHACRNHMRCEPTITPDTQERASR
jgi:hypothetical protein